MKWLLVLCGTEWSQLRGAKRGNRIEKKQLYRNNFNQTYRTFISIYSKQDCQVFFNDVITANALGIFNILLYVNIVLLI